MSKFLWQFLKIAPVVTGSSLLLANLAAAVPNPDAENTFPGSSEMLQQIDSYSSEGIDSSLGQSVQGASKFRDVRPTDWAFQALDDLIKRYDCLVGYPDGSFRGNRPLTRYEFAAGLNACLNQIERLIASSGSGFATKEDLETLRRLMQEFEAELATLGTRVDNLEARTAFLEDHQFSTTTKLRPEVIFAANEMFNDPGELYDTNRDGIRERRFTDTGNATFVNRIRFNFDTSFTGKDRLRVRLEAGNAGTYSLLSSSGVTREGRYGFESNSDNSVFVNDLWYSFPILNDRGKVMVGTSGLDLDDVFNPISPFESSGTGSISRFGRFSPIYRVGQGAGISAEVALNDWVSIAGTYLASEASNPSPGAGLLGGDHVAAGQLTLTPFDKRLTIGLTYANAYASNGMGWAIGSRPANFNVRGNPFFGTGTAPVVSNNYGVQAIFNLTDKIFVGGWAGYTAARAINTGDGDIWYWNSYVGVDDFGLAGSRLGLMFGMEPKLVGSSPNIGTLNVAGLGNNLGNRADRDTSYHVEAFYRIPVNKYITITPGLIWITAPGMNSLNPDLWLGTVRTTFSF
ncbi:iron uptake porin [Oscillatoria sp. FACHB-1406]|uniref:iron uptake porin n=1 Tax=Oscillatoria sp. FACHB-1406 TaxID=2692846 RepID=UPI0016823B62|nr:iron uptake porin [Oscillatoria sp. FACHB-1406]MBD2580474.1 iron uptake porin [Oscillatoria sp. FACHB-1406]